MFIILFKWCSTGKSSLLEQFANERFDPLFKATIGVDCREKSFFQNGKQMSVTVWDTAGQEQFQSQMNGLYFRGADACAIIYDVTSEKSLENVVRWAEQVR